MRIMRTAETPKKLKSREAEEAEDRFVSEAIEAEERGMARRRKGRVWETSNLQRFSRGCEGWAYPVRWDT